MAHHKMTVTVAYATPDMQVEIPVTIETHANVSMAIKKSGILAQFPDITFPDIAVGIYGRRVLIDAGLVDGDRIEIYRPLIADPKEIRRQRAAEGKVMKKGGDSA